MENTPRYLWSFRKKTQSFRLFQNVAGETNFWRQFMSLSAQNYNIFSPRKTIFSFYNAELVDMGVSAERIQFPVLRQSPIIWENNTTIRTRFWFGCYPAYGFHAAEKRRVSPPQYLLYLINHHWFCLSVEPPLLYPEKLLQSCRAVQSPFVLLFILRMYNKRSNICLQALHKCNDAGYLCVTADFNLFYRETEPMVVDQV